MPGRQTQQNAIDDVSVVMPNTSVSTILENDHLCAAGFLPKQVLTKLSFLSRVLDTVASTGYRFITPTPLTHQRVMAHRSGQTGTTLRDIFGWNQPFALNSIASELLMFMKQADILQTHGDLYLSTVRISSIADDLFLHSGYPTNQSDAVFFGPDSYRFSRFIQHSIQASSHWQPMVWPIRHNKPMRILDIGCGSGVGGVVAARSLAHLDTSLEITMNDINPVALQYTTVNAACAGIPIKFAKGDALSVVAGNFDLIICNPPYLYDYSKRIYRHGGDSLGRALSMRIAVDALARLNPGGQLLFYTGVAIIDGTDPFLTELLPLLSSAGCEWSYSEIDPDVFGEELVQPLYAQVDRIAAVGLIARRKCGADLCK